jgi:hypothetical protein
MTSALLVRRTGHTFEVIEGPIPIGDAITKWKAAVNADVAAPAAPGVANPVAIQVLELQIVRSHKLRGLESCTAEQAAPVSSSDEGDTAPPAGDSATTDAAPGDESQPDPAPAEDQAPRGRRKN